MARDERLIRAFLARLARTASLSCAPEALDAAVRDTLASFERTPSVETHVMGPGTP